MSPQPLALDQPRTIRRRRSSTFNAIANWALAVQPGSPAPLSPKRSPLGVSSFVVVTTPTSAKSNRTPVSAKDFSQEIDLTSMGYTSVFVRLPVTPSTPSPFRVQHAQAGTPQQPASPKPTKGLKKFRSMGMLKRVRDKSVASAPISPTRSHSGTTSSQKPAPSPSKSKTRAKAKAHPPLPPALQTELLLMQFAGGGSLETNAQRLMEQRAKGNGTRSVVDAVYKDENGMMWFDEAERVEYQPLISPTQSATPSSPASPWVQFGTFSVKPVSPTIGAIMASSSHDRQEPVRRGSVTSMSPTERELDAGMAALVRPVSPSVYFGCCVDMKKRRRPAPLKLHSAQAAIARATQGFDDTFEPIAAEVVVLAAGNHIHRSRKAKMISSRLGSAPAEVSKFDDDSIDQCYEPEPARAQQDTVESSRKPKMGLAKRAKALFGRN